jgi:outer membrane receptor for ferrienterochelin and colicins
VFLELPLPIKMKITIRLWGETILLLFALSSFSQNHVEILVKDEVTGLPMSGAVIGYYALTHTSKPVYIIATGKDGQLSTMQQLPVIVKISYLGYETILDTIRTPGKREYTMHLEVNKLKDVVVTGQYSPSSVVGSVYDVRVFNEEIIKNKGAVNLQDALSNELNISQSADPVFGSGLSINGISGEGVKVMIDGVPVVGRLDGKLDLSQINLNNIERVEVVEGPLSVIYGTDAMGGVINLITNSFQKERLRVFAKGYYETVGQYNADAGVIYREKNHQLNVNFGRYFFDGFSAVDTYQRFSEWRPKEQYMSDVKYTYSGSKFRFSLAGSWFSELMLNRGEPKYVSDRVNAKDERFLTFRPRVNATFLYRFTNNSTLDIVAGYSGFFRYWNTVMKNLVSMKETLISSEMQDTSTYHQWVLRPIYSMFTKGNRIGFQFGLDINQEFSSQQRLKNNSQQITDAAAFGSMKWNVTKTFVVQPAVRFAYNSKFRSPIVPSLNIKYSHNEDFTLRASYGLGFRAPSLKELYLDFKDSNHDIVGNENLKPETGHNTQLSSNIIFRKQEHKIEWQPSFFFNYITNKIDLKMVPPSPETSPGVVAYAYDNFKHVLTYGGDVTVNYYWKKLSVGAGVLLTQFETIDDNIKERTIKNLSTDASARLGYIIPKADISLNLFYKYTGRRALFSMNSSISTGYVNGFHTIDITASRNFWKDRIQLTMGGKNLTNVTNVITQNASGAGHTGTGANGLMINRGVSFFISLVLQYSR